MIKVSRSYAAWYGVVVAVWVALLESDWLVLWGPDTTWNSYVVVFGWGALTIRRTACDVAALQAAASEAWRKGHARGYAEGLARAAEIEREMARL